MKRFLSAALLTLTAFAGPVAGEDKDKSEGVVVRIGKLRSQAPKDWKQERPTSRMRAYQFRLPGGGAADAELLVFRGIGGSAKANVERWKKQFTSAKDKTTEMKVGSYTTLYLDIEGTYNSGMPFGPQGPQKDYRMLGVCIEIPDNPSQIILRGPAKTVAKYKKEFDDWLKAFK
jgi:hypothetical protein